MNEPEKQPWGVAIGLLVVCAVTWLITLAGVFEATSAPQNLILIVSKCGTIACALWLVFLAVQGLRSRKN
jgi:threonine/homoserine/homoserine lactone efflux protein